MYHVNGSMCKNPYYDKSTIVDTFKEAREFASMLNRMGYTKIEIRKISEDDYRTIETARRLKGGEPT